MNYREAHKSSTTGTLNLSYLCSRFLTFKLHLQLQVIVLSCVFPPGLCFAKTCKLLLTASWITLHRCSVCILNIHAPIFHVEGWFFPKLPSRRPPNRPHLRSHPATCGTPQQIRVFEFYAAVATIEVIAYSHDEAKLTSMTTTIPK